MCHLRHAALALAAIGSSFVGSGCHRYSCPVMPAECFSAEPGDRAVVKFMTYNILKFENEENWERRKANVIQTIVDAAPDVLAIQELTARQGDDVREGLAGYCGISVANQDKDRQNLKNAIFVREDRFRFLDYGHFWFSATPEWPSNQWHNAIPRVCLWSRIEDLRSGRSFYFYNVHLDHKNEKARIKSVFLLGDRLKKRTHSDPYVVAGDFNVNHDNIVIRCMHSEPEVDVSAPDCRQVRLADTFNAARFDQTPSTTFNKFPASLLLKRLDYIFVPSFVELLDGEIIQHKETSDHYPVTATIRFPRGQIRRFNTSPAGR